jgi:hypothetical protein
MHHPSIHPSSHSILTGYLLWARPSQVPLGYAIDQNLPETFLQGCWCLLGEAEEYIDEYNLYGKALWWSTGILPA